MLVYRKLLSILASTLFIVIGCDNAEDDRTPYQHSYPAEIYIYIKDIDTGRGLTDVTVEIFEPGKQWICWRGRTGDRNQTAPGNNGLAELQPNHEYEVFARKDGYITNSKLVNSGNLTFHSGGDPKDKYLVISETIYLSQR